MRPNGRHEGCVAPVQPWITNHLASAAQQDSRIGPPGNGTRGNLDWMLTQQIAGESTGRAPPPVSGLIAAQVVGITFIPRGLLPEAAPVGRKQCNLLAGGALIDGQYAAIRRHGMLFNPAGVGVMILTETQKRTFAEDGVLVVPDVVPEQLCRAVIDEIERFCEIDPAVPTTWYQARFAGHGIVPVHHAQALWDVRQHPAVHAVFSDLYAREDLWVSMDRLSFKPPHSAQTENWRTEPLHWDCDPWQFSGPSLQGLVYLTDTDETQGAFCCGVDVFRDLPAYLARHANDPDRRHPSAAVTGFGGRAGSLLVFNRLMPHSSLPNRSDAPRFVQYVTMQPAGDDAERTARIEAWQSKIPPDWAIRQHVPQQQIPEPGAAATLTALGRQLVGLDRW